jgi:septum formation inhibitor MinC
LSNKEILEMFDILESEDKYLITKINCSKKLKEEIVIVRGSIRNGETKVINNSLLLVGNVNRGGKIIVDGNLYVLGKINGDVELKGDMNKIYCESINNSFIKIGGYYGIFTNELLDQVIYVSEKKVVNNAYRIGENYNGKSNSCYIW